MMMKTKNSPFALLGILVGGMLLSASNSQADWGRPQSAFNYRVTYQQWDSGFSSYYQYREICSQSYGGYGVYQTCYNSSYFTPSTYVYIEEYQMSGGYHRVRVFRDRHHHELYATYYIYESGPIRRVEYREFYSEPDFSFPYESDSFIEHRHVWHSFDWNHGFAEVMVGAAGVGIGATVLASSGGDPALTLLGVGSMALGSLSVSAGLNEMHESRLHSHLIRTHYHHGLDIR